MPNEFALSYESGNNTYKTLRNKAGKVLDGTVDPYHSTNSWVDWNVANVDDYDLAMVDKNGDLYIGSMPSGTLRITDADIYIVQSWLRLGANPADGDDLIGDGLIGWDGTAEISEKISKAGSTIVVGTVDNTVFAPTTTEFEADDITEATDDHFNGRVVIFTSGALKDQATDITDYTLTGGRGHFTVTAMTEAPANNDTFVIV